MSDNTLWYFAYGSNLSAETFVGRRGLKPLDTRVGYLRGYQLVFDIAVGGQRAVANVASDDNGYIWGAIYKLDFDDAERLDRSEGVHRGLYRRIEVDIRGADDQITPAFTYESEHRTDGRMPSRRYMNIILTGAREHGIQPDYIDWLRTLPLAIDERLNQEELFKPDTGRS